MTEKTQRVLESIRALPEDLRAELLEQLKEMRERS
jgi:hypothetical protein